MMRKPLYKKAVITIGIYALLILVGAVLGTLSPGGPCAPGGGALFFATIFPFVALVLFLHDLYNLIRGNKEVYLSFFIQLLIGAILLLGL